jgi:CHASE3 domain sensor protein
MDKFLASFMILVFSVLVLSGVTMFQNKSSAETISNGVKIMLSHTNTRQPAIGNNKE